MVEVAVPEADPGIDRPPVGRVPDEIDTDEPLGQRHVAELEALAAGEVRTGIRVAEAPPGLAKRIGPDGRQYPVGIVPSVVLLSPG